MLVVSLGGRIPPARGPLLSNYHPATLHVLEASTGREQHRVMGMNRIGVADLDGDGLLDLWGDADGQLRALRSDLPEIWRALGSFSPALRPYATPGWTGSRLPVDLDGDGTADTLVSDTSFSGDRARGQRGSRTAMARSGRDGHLLWKTVLDPPRFPFDRDPARSYSLSAFPLPIGDFDGDGAPDVIVRRQTGDDEPPRDRRPASLPIQVLSGRTGRPLWSAGPLPLGFEAYGESQVTWFEAVIIEPGTSPDLLVRHRNPFRTGSVTPVPPSPWVPAQDRLARVSGSHRPGPLGHRHRRAVLDPAQPAGDSEARRY